MRTKLLTTAALLACTAGHAWATDVYPGCAVPALKNGHKTFWVDPEKGSMTGDGSAAKPWHTLTEVIDPKYKLISTQSNVRGTIQPVNPNAPIKAGDVIMLKSGNHGGGVFLQNMFNTDFITVAAAPGQTPEINFLSIQSGSKWLFQGIKFQGLFPAGADRNKMGGLIRIGYGEWQGASKDLVFEGNAVSGTGDTQGWSASDWQGKPFSNAFYLRSSCVSLISNHIYNVNNAVYMQGDNGLFKGNTIDHFFTDAFDMVGSNLTISKNTVKDNTSTSGVVLHPDAVQGWSLPGVTNKNFVIDSNLISRRNDNVGGWMQGISIFDGKWDGVTITNNSVATNAWTAINLAGVANAKIINNTVVSTGPNPIWIAVTPGKDNTPAQHPIIRNNIAPQIIAFGNGAVVDHNIASKSFSIPATSGRQAFSGVVGDSNKVSPTVMSQFMAVNNAANDFDLRLRATSAAIGYGNADGAPSTDLTGKSRSRPVDVGAFTH